MNSITYKKIDKSNWKIAYDIQAREWPESKAYDHFKKIANSTDPKNISFIAYLHNEPIGICGVYQVKIDPKTLWLDWFCIDKKYRGHGYGRQILLDTIEYCKKFADIDFFRVDTILKTTRPSSILYIKEMDMIEKYTKEDTEILKHGWYICSKVLKNNCDLIAWNNRYLDLFDESGKERV